jgi:hypothetical protein
MPATVRLALAPLVAALVSAGAAAQTTHTWTGGGGSGNWATAANWDVLPVSGNARVVLTDVAQTATTQNFAAPVPFVLNRLQMNSGAASGFSVSGNPLRFEHPGAWIQSASTGGPLTVNTAVDFGVSTAVNLNANFAAGVEVVLAGRLTSPAAVTLTVGGGLGTGLAISGRDNGGFQGTLGFAPAAQAVVSLGGHNALSRATVVDLTGGAATSGVRSATTAAVGAGFAAAGFHQQLGNLAGAADSNNAVTAGQFQVGNTADPSTVLVGFDGRDSAVTSDGGGASLVGGNAGSHFGKVGAGTLTYGGASPASAMAVSVRDGTLLLQSPGATNGGFQNGANAQGDVSVYAGATLRLNNGAGSGNNQNRIGNTATVALGGGTLRLDGSATAATSERVGGVRLQSGQSTVEVNAPGRGTRFTLAGPLAAAGTATLFVRAAGVGEGLSTSTTAAAPGVNFDALGDATALLRGGVTSGTYAAAAANLGVIPFATTGAAAPATFVTFDAANQSVRGLADGNYAPALGTADANVSLGAAATLGGNQTANAVRLTAGGSVALGGNALTISSGALLSAGGGDVTGTGPLTFGAGGGATAYLTTTGGMTVAAPVSAASLSKSGAGTLTLTGPVTLGTAAGAGVVGVNAGTLAVGAGGSVANARVYQVSRGATLDVTAGGLTLGTGQTLRGSGAVTGAVTVGNGGTVAPSALGGGAADLASPGTLSVAGMTWQPGGRYEWAVSSVHGGAYTHSRIAGSGGLDLTGLSAANRFTLALRPLALSNADGGVYDFDNLQGYTWTVASFAGGVSGFAADKFAVDAAAFAAATPLGGGAFGVRLAGNDLQVVFTPVPEPATLAGAAALALLAAARRRRPTPPAAGSTC